MIPVSPLKRIVIAGGGFGGMALAKALRNKPYQVVLIDKNNYHTFQPLLYQVATGGLEPDSIAFPLRKVFHGAENVVFRMAEIINVDFDKKNVDTTIGTIAFDFLVLATGSANNFFNNTSVAENAMTLKSVSEALNIRSLVLQNLEAALVADEKDRQALLNIVVAGAGPTGVEVAGALAELRRHVIPNDYPELKNLAINIYIVEASERVLASMSEKSSEKALLFLKKLGVIPRLNVKLDSYDGNTAVLSDGTIIPTKIVVWSAGVKGKLTGGIPESVITPGSRIEVNSFCQVKGFDSVYALGDVAMLSSKENPKGFPMVAPVAIQQADLIAKNFLRMKEGKELKAFHYFDKGSMATVGRNKAVVDLPFISFQGLFAWFAWMFVHLMSLVGFRNKLMVFINWLWSYFSYDRAVRLIIRPYKKK
ncbi:MAG: NAD(P)/FAD-dependent oxidoreductase [Bacteroidota bacterium]